MNRRKLLTFIGLAPLAPIAAKAIGQPTPVPDRAVMAYWSEYGSMDFINLTPSEINNSTREIMRILAK